ncbi:hypothetical protein D9M68_692940 [compost metagenome]
MRFGAHRRIAAVDGVVGASDEAGVVRTQEQHHLGHFVGVADALQQVEGGGHTVGLGAVALGQLVHDGRPGPAGRHAVDPDVIGCQVHGHVARQLHQRGLADRVEPAASLGHARRDAGEVDHRPAADLLHVRVHRLEHHHRADHVHVQGFVPVGAARPQPVVHVRAGQVDEEVDAAEARGGLVRAGTHLGVVGDVGGAEPHAFTAAIGHRLAASGVDVGQCDANTLGVQGPHCGGADEGGAAGDDGGFAGQTEKSGFGHGVSCFLNHAA